MKKALLLCLLLSSSFNLLNAQAIGEETRQQKEQELKTVLANKSKSMSDFVRFIPYDLPMVNRSFYKWTKKNVVFYKQQGATVVPILPAELDETVKADYESALNQPQSADYYAKWRQFFEEKCYAQREGGAVVERYLNDKIDLIACLAKFRTADNPDGYTAYVQPLVFHALLQDAKNWDVLYGAYKHLSSEQSKAVIALAAMLCRTSNTVKQWIDVLSIMPKPKKFYQAVNNETYCNDADMLSGSFPLPKSSSEEYGNCLSGFIVYVDGTVVMRRTKESCPTYNNLQEPLDYIENNRICTTFCEQDYTFMYLPSGKAYLGHMKEQGSVGRDGDFSQGAVWKSDGRYVPSVRYDLALGLEFDRNANVVKENYYGKNVQELNAMFDVAREMANDPTNVNNYNPQWVEQGDRILRKYGEKPWNALVTLELYVGFPENLLKEYIFYNPEKWSSGGGMHAFRLLANYGNSRTYVYTNALRAILGGKYERCRIWCRNGKVSAIEYNYHGPF